MTLLTSTGTISFSAQMTRTEAVRQNKLESLRLGPCSAQKGRSCSFPFKPALKHSCQIGVPKKRTFFWLPFKSKNARSPPKTKRETQKKKCALRKAAHPTLPRHDPCSVGRTHPKLSRLRRHVCVKVLGAEIRLTGVDRQRMGHGMTPRKAKPSPIRCLQGNPLPVHSQNSEGQSLPIAPARRLLQLTSWSLIDLLPKANLEVCFWRVPFCGMQRKRYFGCS